MNRMPNTKKIELVPTHTHTQFTFANGKSMVKAVHVERKNNNNTM